MNKENQAHKEPNEIFPEKERDFYQKLRNTVRIWYEKDGTKNKWAEYIILAPDLFHLLVKLSLDPDVPGKHKVKLAGVVVYFLSPIDILPEVILGPIGLLDEIALTAYVLNTMLNEVEPEVIQRHWAGDGDILDTIKRIVGMTDAMIGSGMFRKILYKFGSRDGKRDHE